MAPNDVRTHILDTGLTLVARKGFTAMGLSELLSTAKVPKGSFYHWFASKEAFGEALLDRYFEGYLEGLEHLMGDPDCRARDCLAEYWERWVISQDPSSCGNACVVVKLAGEVSDLSEAMRLALKRGTIEVERRLGHLIADAIAEGDVPADLDPDTTARELYALWLGASLQAKIHRNADPLHLVYRFTCHRLGLYPTLPSDLPPSSSTCPG